MDPTANQKKEEEVPYWKETAELFGKLFDRPKMREDRLKAPKFRFLHAIFNSTMVKTGFGENLFEEIDKDY